MDTYPGQDGAPEAGYRDEAGFTLLELMLATAVLAAVAVAIGLVMTSVDRSDRHAQEWTASYRAAQKVMEEILSLEYSETPLQDGLVFTVLATSIPTQGTVAVEDVGAEWGGAAGTAYRITISIRDQELGVEADLTTVRSMY
ncbi:MAG: prepilin-type N-terminal cleavage/methylation domain-containing protein [Planctomycetes bacterium]|nr:prepilin-type N-terminal cleavage/methylation domain-containing protein [Planctomycetota bacterium]